MLKLGTVSSFHPHGMCKIVERVMEKTRRASCTNWTMSFGVSGFRTRTHLLHWHFIFLNLLQLQAFFAFPTHHSKRHYKFSTLSNIISYLQSFTDLFRELNDHDIENHYKMNSEKVETWQGIIISPHSMCKKVERVTAKLDALRVQTGQSLSKYQGFERKRIYYIGNSKF